MKWKVGENKELPVAVIEDTEDGFGICELDGGGTASREELEKTARLIAATPDLLDACEDFPPKARGQTFEQFYNCCMSWDRTCRQTAIRKAKKRIT